MIGVGYLPATRIHHPGGLALTHPKRVAARRSLAFVAALAVTATLSAAARAQEPGTPTATAAEPTATTTTATAPVQARPSGTGSPATAPATTSTSPAASAAKLAISATAGAGTYLVGAKIPVEVRLANTGDADATGVLAGVHSASGSHFSVQSSEWGDLSNFPGNAGITLRAGQERVLTVHGEVQQWSGAVPVARFFIQQGTTWVTTFDVRIPVRDPDSARDVLAGLVYGDRNGNGKPDTGEALRGVRVNLSTSGGPDRVGLDATTDAEGRFRFANLPVRVYSLHITDEPDGWVVEPSYSSVAVDGSGSAANLLLRGERPLTDQLSATMEFTRDAYRVGDRAEIAVTLTNRGAADLTGIMAGCDRSGGEGPELRDVTVADPGWPADGVTVPAGRSVVLTVVGTVSEESAEYGAVAYGCDFGPGWDAVDGRPVAHAVAKVPGPPTTLRLAYYHDRDQDWTGDADEWIGGLGMDLRDAVTGEVVARGRTDARGRVTFENVPAGPYVLRFRGHWGRGGSPYPGVVYAGTCWNCQSVYTTALVPGPDPTKARRAGG